MAVIAALEEKRKIMESLKMKQEFNGDLHNEMEQEPSDPPMKQELFPADSPLSAEEENSFRELENELDSLRNTIVQMEAERDSVQKEIAIAVENEEYVVAAELATKKKQIIGDLEERQKALDALATELQGCAEENGSNKSQGNGDGMVDDDVTL